MRLAPWSRVSAVVIGEDLALTVVASTVFGARAWRGPTLRRFLSMSAEEARDGVAPLRSAGRLTLTVPGAWCAIRRIQISTSQWGRAQAEILQSLDTLLPLNIEDAMVGLIDAGPAEGQDASGGWLVGVRRSQAQPWIDALERALGQPVSEALSPHMAMLGLGMQHDVTGEVVEPLSASGGQSVALRHVFEFGRPVALAEPVRGDPTSVAVRLVLCGTSSETVFGPSERAIDAHDLAIGAALAPVVARGRFAPLVGKTTRPARRWALPLAASAAAAGLLFAAGIAYDSRLTKATATLQANQSALQGRVDGVQRLRDRAERLTRLVAAGVMAPTAEWASVLPVALQAQEALGADGYAYRLEIGKANITLSGEAGSASGVLERLEASEALKSARQGAPVSKSSNSGKDVFELRAERVKKGEAK